MGKNTAFFETVVWKQWFLRLYLRQSLHTRRPHKSRVPMSHLQFHHPSIIHLPLTLCPSCSSTSICRREKTPAPAALTARKLQEALHRPLSRSLFKWQNTIPYFLKTWLSIQPVQSPETCSRAHPHHLGNNLWIFHQPQLSPAAHKQDVLGETQNEGTKFGGCLSYTQMMKGLWQDWWEGQGQLVQILIWLGEDYFFSLAHVFWSVLFVLMGKICPRAT